MIRFDKDIFMATDNSPSLSLQDIPANRRLVDELWSNRLISTKAKEYALNLIYLPRNWGLWAARILLIVGITLILSGILYFFAFNWNELTISMKLGSIQVALIAAVIGAYYYKLDHLVGKILLFAAAALVGVFLAVFGQIYQTGADAYTLFMLWAVLILPWVVIGELTGLWVFWIIISNICIILYWWQVGPVRQQANMIFVYLTILNGLLLALKEYFQIKGFEFLKPQWFRVLLVLLVLGYAFIPTFLCIYFPKEVNSAIILGTILAAVAHISFYILYRYSILSIGAIAATFLSAATIAVVILWKLLSLTTDSSLFGIFAYLLMGCATLGIFTFTIIKLRSIDKEMRENHVTR